MFINNDSLLIGFVNDIKSAKNHGGVCQEGDEDEVDDNID